MSKQSTLNPGISHQAYFLNYSGISNPQEGRIMFCGITRIFFDAWNIALLKCHIRLIPLDSVKACLFPEESMR